MAKKAPPPEIDEFGLPPLIRTETLALMIGVGPRRLHQLVTDGRIEKDCLFGGEKWHTMKTITSVFAYYRRQLDQKKTPQAMDAQLLQENLRALKIKNAKAAKELLPRDVMARVFGGLLAVFKDRWLNFADKMAPRVFRAKDKVEAAEILDREVRSIFNALQDPAVMAQLEKSIDEDAFESGDAAQPSGDPDEEPGSENLVEEDA